MSTTTINDSNFLPHTFETSGNEHILRLSCTRVDSDMLKLIRDYIKDKTCISFNFGVISGEILIELFELMFVNKISCVEFYGATPEREQIYQSESVSLLIVMRKVELVVRLIGDPRIDTLIFNNCRTLYFKMVADTFPTNIRKLILRGEYKTVKDINYVHNFKNLKKLDLSLYGIEKTNLEELVRIITDSRITTFKYIGDVECDNLLLRLISETRLKKLFYSDSRYQSVLSIDSGLLLHELSKNKTIKKLCISNEFSEPINRDEFCRMISNNNILNELELGNGVYPSYIADEKIIEAMNNNYTLTKINIYQCAEVCQIISRNLELYNNRRFRTTKKANA